MPEPESFSQVLQSGYTLSYDKASKTWALNQVTPTSGLSSLWASLTRIKPTDDIKLPLWFQNPVQIPCTDFLTTIQDMDLSMDMKSKITEICINKTDNTGN